ncbi:MAG TPA: serine hydrolase domain-containing protein [Acidimicrobiales bacterium]
MHRRTIAGWRSLGGATLAALVLAACSTTSSAPPSPTATLSDALGHLVATPGGPPGAIALIEVGDTPKVLTAGVGNVASHRVIAVDDTTRLASVSKAFNGAVALALVSQGKLTLADTIGKWLPSLPPAWATVTLAQLLQHTGGVPDYIKSPAFLRELQSDPQAVMTPAQLLGFVATEPLDFLPGSKYEYSDSDNIVVGLMIEAVTGGSYESALARYVTIPLDLTKTTLPANAQMTEPYVHGYSVEAGKAPEDDTTALNPGLAWASGGMNSTPAELNTFMRAYVSGHLFDAATQKQQLQFVPGDSGPPGPGTNSAGLAVFRYQTSCGTVYGHSGNYPGYTAFAASNLQGTRSVVVIVNEQLNSGTTTTAFTQLRHVWELSVCAALAP